LTQWIEENAPGVQHNLSSSCAATISIDQLIQLSEHPEASEQALSIRSLSLSYGSGRGNETLRENLAALYSARVAGVTKDHILTTHAASDANNIILNALLAPGDHVICQYPTYPQLYQFPAALGAEVSLWKADPTKKWQLDEEELKTMIKPHTKLIVLNNPGNPSGAIIPRPKLESIVAIAREKGITIFCDEVFRPLFHSIQVSSEDFPPSAINLGYNNIVATGSFSKAYSLPGIRVGWIASRNTDIIEACVNVRYYTTSSMSVLDEAVAAEAVSDRCIHPLLGQNIKRAKTNVELFQSFIEEHAWACSWVPPVAGATAMVKFVKMGKPVDDVELCLRVKQSVGLLLVPASKCFGGGAEYHGYVRVGLAMDTAAFKASVAALRKFMEEDFENVPVARK
jgi:aspartate/methionine/tyrosine aminotransferase